MTMEAIDELRAAWNAVADQHNQWDALGIDEIVEFAQARSASAERERCAMALDVTRAEVSLAAGEMTAQEWRTCQAVLRWMQHRIRAGN